MATYFNENDQFAANWLSNLFPDDCIDDRSIEKVKTGDISEFTRCHFFAGIGGWEIALRLAGWPKSREVWTGSCPCQPFSKAAGSKIKKERDSRHLWPQFFRIISKRHPTTIFGEQTTGDAGYKWLSGIRADLEAEGYAFGAADLCAASAGAPHPRQRIFWVADSLRHRLQGRDTFLGKYEYNEISENSIVFNAWDDYDVITFPNGRKRRIESGIMPLADGVSKRVGQIRGYGNAIVPQVAAKFIQAFMQTKSI